MSTRRHLLGLLGWLAVLWLLVAGQVLAQSVTTEGGNVLFSAESGAPYVQLTDSGLDRGAILMPDGQLIAFIRSTPGRLTETAAGPAELTEIRTIRTDGLNPTLLVSGHAGTADDNALADFDTLIAAPDGGTIYFEAVGGATGLSQAIHAVDVTTGQVRFVVRGALQAVVPSGAYAGDLLIRAHRYFAGGGSYDWVWLVAPDGQETGPLGDPGDPDYPRRLRSVLGEAAAL